MRTIAFLLLAVFACKSEEGCTHEERCVKKGGKWRVENCRTVPHTHMQSLSFDGGKTYTYMPITTWQTECDEWCQYPAERGVQ